MSHLIQVNKVSKNFPTKNCKNAILSDINLCISTGELITLVGPTGSGKSTLLNLILGADSPSSGEILMEGKRIESPKRNRGVVFQKYSLFEHLTVRENLMLGLEFEAFSLVTQYCTFFKRRKKREFKKEVDTYLERVGLLEHAKKYPFQLSGGQKQRAAICQAMIMKPKVLLMDEPFGALDEEIREIMQLFLLEQWQKSKQTIIFVTHDLSEALFLGNRLIVLSHYYKNAHGSKIVKDIALNWNLPRNVAMKNSKEFDILMKSIRKEGLNPYFLQAPSEFDITQCSSFH